MWLSQIYWWWLSQFLPVNICQFCVYLCFDKFYANSNNLKRITTIWGQPLALIATSRLVVPPPECDGDSGIDNVGNHPTWMWPQNSLKLHSNQLDHLLHQTNLVSKFILQNPLGLSFNSQQKLQYFDPIIPFVLILCEFLAKWFAAKWTFFSFLVPFHSFVPIHKLDHDDPQGGLYLGKTTWLDQVQIETMKLTKILFQNKPIKIFLKIFAHWISTFQLLSQYIKACLCLLLYSTLNI